MIGFMQGRLVDTVNGKIQAFPKDQWRKELKIASENSFNKIELTVDLEGVWDNPLTEKKGINELKKYLKEYEIEPLACTADFIMHEPPWRSDSKRQEYLLRVLRSVLNGLGSLSTPILVFPLVDESSITYSEEGELMSFLENIEDDLAINGIKIAFESDYPPKELKRFIDQFNPEFYGINYDIGNSASLGYDPKEEISTYHDSIIHVHVKDRFFKGSTTKLGTGDADLKLCIRMLTSFNYSGDYVLQTARDPEDRHIKVLNFNREYFLSLFENL